MKFANLAAAAAAGLSWFTASAHAKRHGNLPDFEFPLQAKHKDNPRTRCPLQCDDSGPVPISWSVMPSIKSFGRCNSTVIFDIPVRKPLAELDGTDGIRACSAEGSVAVPIKDKYGPVCVADAKLHDAVADVEVGWWLRGAGAASPVSILTTLQHLRKNILEDPTCRPTALFAKSGNTVMALYVGSEIRKASVAPLLERFAEFVGPQASNLLPRRAVAQICGPGGKRSAPHVFGLVYDTTGSMEKVDAALRGWLKGDCVTGFDDKDSWKDQKLSIIPAVALTMGTKFALTSNSTFGASATNTTTTVAVNKRGRVTRATADVGQSPAGFGHVLHARADCKAEKVIPGDSCWGIAQRCGVTEANLYKWNGGGSSAFCSSIQPGDYLCCSAGTMPNMDPKPNLDGTCTYVQVESGDTCLTIAENRCPSKISQTQLSSFNSGINCNNLKLKSVVCCTQGTKPDLRPQEGTDGGCAVHQVGKGEICYDIQEKFMLEQGDIEKFNQNKTWGFSDCSRLGENMLICLSDGYPPMPAPIKDAQCGPQVEGTQRPTNGTKLADLNKCHLNVCCNIWGNCGTTSDFCIDTSINGAPGTAKTGTFGCISNCGMDIVNNAQGPAKFHRLGYFEAWNQDRACLHMDVTDIKEPHTMIHFAFGWINEDFTVSVKGVEEQFEKFKNLNNGIKKIISWGGWAFSNEAPTTHIIRKAVRPENVGAFVNNVVNFVVDNNLDGVDFDWEYPGATDIQYADPGNPEDGPNYLAFLKMLKRRLTGKTVSFAAPASYWYLRHFPIADIAKVADYIVYMTYDLHGQWDVGNKYVSEGCENGNCLRSHINSTLTENALAMITKAGVPSYKIFVGITSYGRSFKMAEPGCDGPMCLYLGERNLSPAAPGYCTNTSGYISEAEIRQIRKMSDYEGDDSYYEFYDKASDSDIIVYNDVEWVAWMDTETKNRRIEWYRQMNFGGVSDWAVDLQEDMGGRGTDSKEFDWGALDVTWNCKTQRYNDLDDLYSNTEGVEPTCLAISAVDTLQGMLYNSFDGYNDAADGYDDLFDYYTDYIRSTLNDRVRHLMTRDDKKLLPYFNCYYQEGMSGKREGANKYDCKDPPSEYMQSYTFFYEIRDGKGLNETLESEGILWEWLNWDLWEDVTKCQWTSGGFGMCFDVYRMHHGFPFGKKDFEVPDPKEVIDKARDNFDVMDAEYSFMKMNLGAEVFMGNPADAVDVLATPVFMLQDAIKSMQTVKEKGQEWKELQKKELIFKILEIVLFLIPFVGAAVGALGRTGAMIGRMLMAIEAGASAGLGMYELIEHPEMAPLAILMMILGGLGSGGWGGATRYKTLADTKTKMTSVQKKNMGESFELNQPKVDKILAKICS